MTDSRVRLSVTWIAKPGSEDRVKDILNRLARATSVEPGCLRYTVLQSIDDPRHFVLYEEYRDAAAVREHSESAHFQHLVVGEAVPLLESRERVEVGLLADSVRGDE